jgi:hypothetical protein
VQETEFGKAAILKNATIYSVSAFIEAHVDGKIVYYRNKKFLKSASRPLCFHYKL